MVDNRVTESSDGEEAPRVSAAEGAVREIARSGAGREITELPALLQNLPEKDHWQDIRLKRIYAPALLIAHGVQIAIADGVFVAYAWAGTDWKLAEGVINVWLGATVVQVIGVVLVVTRSPVATAPPEVFWSHLSTLADQAPVSSSLMSCERASGVSCSIPKPTRSIPRLSISSTAIASSAAVCPAARGGVAW